MEANQEKKWCVYKHTNKINGKVYIGQTCKQPEKRWRNGKGTKGANIFIMPFKNMVGTILNMKSYMII